MTEVLSSGQTPPRGFAQSEFEARTRRAQEHMLAAKIDALLLTTEPEFRYFSGFHSQFWESPTRPWYLVLPSEGRPIAVIPEIGAAGMRTTWVEEIHTWPAPQPADDGLTLLSGLLQKHLGKHGRLGVPLGHETLVRMPGSDYRRLCEDLGPVEVVDATPIVRALRMVKSEAEIEKIAHVCRLASDAFEALSAQSALGQSEREICKALRLDILRRGADAVPYLVAGSGPGGYDNIIMGPTDRTLEAGDVLIIDTGSTFDGYFCDFDRNYAFGPVSDEARKAYDVVYAATEAGFAALRPGITAADLCAAMWQVMEAGGALGNDVGRLGHGLGMQLTEWPSNMAEDDTVLEAGMVLTLEPGMVFAPGKLMVHEENVVLREDGPVMLSRRAPPEMYLVS